MLCRQKHFGEHYLVSPLVDVVHLEIKGEVRVGSYCFLVKAEQHVDLAFVELWKRPSELTIEHTARKAKWVLTQRHCRLSLSKLILVSFTCTSDVHDPPPSCNCLLKRDCVSHCSTAPHIIYYPFVIVASCLSKPIKNESHNTGVLSSSQAYFSLRRRRVVLRPRNYVLGDEV